MAEEFWYRYEDIRYAPSLDEFERPQGDGHLEVALRKFLVTKHTPKGVILDGHRFVRNEARKQYACPTIEAARASFLARKRRQLGIYEARARDARQAIALVTDKQMAEIGL